MHSATAFQLRLYTHRPSRADPFTRVTSVPSFPTHFHREASKARAGGGHLIWLGIHFLDMANYITGSSVVEASGFTANVGCVSIRKELKLCIDTVPCKGAILTLMLKVEVCLVLL